MAHDDDPCLVCGCVQAEDDLRAQVAALRAALVDALAALELPEVTEESTECPDCGAGVEWRGDRGPDIGDCVACDECVEDRLADGEATLRAALALTDAQAGTRWAAMVQVVEAARQIVAHRSDYEANAADVPLVDALAALAALDGGRPGPDRSDPAE